MTGEDRLDGLIAERLRAEAPPSAPPTLLASTLARIGETHRARSGMPFARLLAAAAVVALAVVVGLQLPALIGPPLGTEPSPTPTLAPSPPPDWGPLAVVEATGDEARTEGTLRITERCVFLEIGEGQTLLVWPADSTRWNADEGTISFTNATGHEVTLTSGDLVALGGGGWSPGESGQDVREWVDSIEWIQPPDEACLPGGPGAWFVTSVPQPPSPTASPMPSPTPTALPSASASVPASTQEWQVGRVALPPSDQNAFLALTGVRWYEEVGWLAYGGEVNGQAGLWTSRDGLAWQRAVLPSGLEDHLVLEVDRARVGNQVRFVALLERYEPSRSAILISDDGQHWVPATIPNTTSKALSVAHGDAGFVATTTRSDLPLPQADGFIWRSADGLTWIESRSDAFDNASPYRVEFVGDRYVAIGFPSRSGPPRTAWVSTDLVTWDLHEITPPSESGWLNVVTDASDDRIMLLGLTEQAFISTSMDGVDWTFDWVDQHFFLTGVDVLDDAAVVVGHLDLADGPADVGIWVQDPGSTGWRPVQWRDHLPDVPPSEIENRRSVFVATSPDHTVILIGDGTVLRTGGRLP